MIYWIFVTPQTSFYFWKLHHFLKNKSNSNTLKGSRKYVALPNLMTGFDTGQGQRTVQFHTGFVRIAMDNMVTQGISNWKGRNDEKSDLKSYWKNF